MVFEFLISLRAEIDALLGHNSRAVLPFGMEQGVLYQLAMIMR